MNLRHLRKKLVSTVLIIATVVSLLIPMNANAAVPTPGSIAVGVDVSKYNGGVNWQAARAEGVTFAFVRIGSTLKGMDPLFYQNMQGAAAAGIRTGVYIYSYATTPEQAAAEAMFVLNNLGNCTVSFPIVIDMESNPQKGCSKQALTDVANTFCTIIENAGFYPMVYASKNWFANHMNPIGFDKWVAQYGPVCQDGSRSIWQATNTGRMSGFGGNVDINYLYKDYSPFIISDGFLQRKGATYLYKGWRMQTGWQEFAENRYYLDMTGKMQTGWLQVDDTGRHYMHPTGEMAIGFTEIEKETYFFEAGQGAMQTGFVDTGMGRYFFNPEGKMQKGFLNDGTYTYYFAPGMVAGPVEIDGAHYYFDAEGHMQTGFVEVGDGGRYFYGADGKMQTGFISDGTYTYYCNPYMVIGNWAVIDNKAYYFNAEGKMQLGLINIGDVSYCTDPTGAMITNQLVPLGDAWYYFGADGVMVKNGEMDLNGIHYIFNENGQMISQTLIQ